jgi:hypothetical protein
VPDLMVDGTTCQHLLSAEFENQNPTNGSVTRFAITYGTQGALREIPVTITYQPRWWLQIQLALADGGVPAQAGAVTR